MAKKSTITQDLNDVRQRESAAINARNEALNILNVGNVASMPKTQAEAALSIINKNGGAFTTDIELEDLAKFSKSMSELQEEFNRNNVKGGIHPKTVINMSRREDIERYKKEINTAIPAKKDKAGVVVFRVNASAHSKDVHHMVQVEFLNFHAALAGGRITNNLANAVLQSPVRFDCDCGRHRFWYRYIASVGSFSFGKAESGFPKVRNPNLRGLACKHVIFVMRMITQSQFMTGYMKNYITEFRDKPGQRKKNLTAKQVDAATEALAKESWRHIQVRRTSNNELPKNLRDAFNPSKKVSLKGIKVTPTELAKAKMENLTRLEMVREIQQKLQNPDVAGRTPHQELERMYKVLKGL